MPTIRRNHPDASDWQVETCSSIHIYENDGVEEAATLVALDKVADRVQTFLMDAMKVGPKVRKIYKKSDST
jgi:hypothetical protein